jgi:hypothetical protein
MIQIRPYAPEDYQTIAAWWKGHCWEAVPAAILPKLGVVAESDGHGLCAAFLYMDNSVGVSWMEWLVSNPEAGGMEVVRGLRATIDFLTAEALRLGYGVTMTSCRQSSLVKLYEKAGFGVTDTGVTHLVKINGGN